MAPPPGNGLRNANSLLIEISLHLVEPFVNATVAAPIAAGSQTVALTSGNPLLLATTGMYVGAQVVVTQADGSAPTIATVTAFTPSAATATLTFAQAYAGGAIITGGTFPTQQPTDPLFTQAEVLNYLARAQNELLARVPLIYQVWTGQQIAQGEQFQETPASAIEMERVSLLTSLDSQNIQSISRAGNVVTAVLSAPADFFPALGVLVLGVTDNSYNSAYESNLFTLATVSSDGLTLTWPQPGPNSSSSGGVVGQPVYTRLYEVSQNQLSMANPQWMADTSQPPTKWYEDRTGVYQWGVAPLPLGGYNVNLVTSIRDSDVLALTDHFLLPDMILYIVKAKTMQFVLSKDGEQASPTMAAWWGAKFDRSVMILDRYLRGFVEAQTTRQMAGASQ